MGTGTSSFTAIKAFAIDLAANGISKIAEGISGVRDWFIELYNESLPIRVYFQYMFAMWETGITVVKTAFQRLWEQLKLGGKLIKAVLTFDLSGLKEAFQDYGKNMKSTVVDNAKKVASTWKDAYNAALNGRIEPIKQLVDGAQNTIPGSNVPISTEESKPGSGNNRLQVPKAIDSLDPRIKAEKTYSETVLEESKLRQNILDNEQQAATDRAALDLQIQEDRRAAYLSTLDTIINVFGQESAIGRAALMAKQAYAIAETIINIAKGTGQTAATVPFPANIPLIMGFVGQVAALVGTIKGATKNTKGFAAGGFTQGERMYVAGEAGTEWIAPNWMTSNPATAPIIASLESFRKNRVGLNPEIITMFADGGYTANTMQKLNKMNYAVDPWGITGAKVDKLQNEVLTELVTRIGISLDENTKAMQEVVNKKTYVAIEDIQTHTKNYLRIQATSGLGNNTI